MPAGEKPKGQIRLVAVQAATRTADSYGQLQESWSTIFSTYAEVLPLKGQELVIAKQLRADVTHQLTVQYAVSQPITPLMRILCPLTVRSGTLTSGSAAVSGLSTTLDLIVGQIVDGDDIPSGTFIASIDSGTDLTLSDDATASGASDLTIHRVFNVLSSINEQERDLTRILLCKELVTPT